MHFLSRRGAGVAALAVLGSTLAVPAAADSGWPDRPLHLVIPFPAGGGPERTIRTLADGLQQRLGQPVVIEYKPGASGNIGAQDLASADADGYRWMFSQEGLFTINPHVYPSLGFDPEAIVPVALIGNFVDILVCHPSTGIESLTEFVDHAKANPGVLTYATSGSGSPGHVAMEMFAEQADIDLSHIPYRGPMPAVQDVLGGHVDCGFLVAAIVAEHIRSGRLAALAGSGAEPSPSLPDAPNMSDLGYPDFDATFWLGIFGRRGVDPDILDKFHQAVVDTMQDEAVIEALLDSDTRPVTSTPDEASDRLQALSAKWGRVVRDVGIRID